MLLLGVHVIDVLDSPENRQPAGTSQILSEGQETRAARTAISSINLCPLSVRLRCQDRRFGHDPQLRAFN